MTDKSEKDALMEAASKSLQAHEQLCHLISDSTTALGGDEHKNCVVSEAQSLMDQLRSLKSKIDGSHYEMKFPTLDPVLISKLKLLVKTHTPSSLSEQHKAKLAEHITRVLEGCVKKVLYACLITCPWFAGVQNELSAQAKNNTLFVVYVALDQQFFSLATPHEKQLADTINQEFFFACEVRRFCCELMRGHVRSIEALCASPESVVVCSPQWLHLSQLMDPQHLFGKSFVDACMGQAVGTLSKKKKVERSLELAPDISLVMFCDSCRLLSYVDCVVKDESLCSWSSPLLSGERKCAQRALDLLKAAFKGEVRKDLLFECIVEWKKELCETGFPSKGSVELQRLQLELEKWLVEIRMDGLHLVTPPGPCDEDKQRLSELLQGIKLNAVEPNHMLAVIEAGSRLYNLALPTSDTDYILIFRHPITAVLSSGTSLKESHDSRGQQLLQEAGAYEARMFCEMLLKGAVNIIELLFAEDVVYSSEEWCELVAHRHLFMSEKVVLQYIGYIKTHMQRLSSGKHSGTARERKIFYSIFHKLLSLDNFVDGKFPVVRCSSGPDRDFIMKIRTGPLQGDLASDRLYVLAEQRLNATREKLRARPVRMREFGDHKYLEKWLVSNVRGVATY